MTVIHECSQCGYQGRVVETAETYLCEGCFEQFKQQALDDEQCPECGNQGVTGSGICYACENAPKPAQADPAVTHSE